MGSHYSDDHRPSYQELSSQTLLGAGWRPLYRELEWDYVGQVVSKDPWEFGQRLLDLCSDIADALGRQDYAWWANILQVFSENTRYDVSEFWEYITPPPPGPTYRYRDTLTAEVPASRDINRDHIPIEMVLARFQETTILKCLEKLGPPDQITQRFFDRYFYFPVDRFVSWEQLDSLGLVSAHWSNSDVWLQIKVLGVGKRLFTLLGRDLSGLIHQSTFKLAVMVSGYQSRVGQVQSDFTLKDFAVDVQHFTHKVQQRIHCHHRLAVLVHGEPGTGKTAWTQALAREILVPLGYVVFILDHEAVEQFAPPTYLSRVCLIINEADNLAQDRSSDVARTNTKTEHILSLLDGTLYQSVVDESHSPSKQRLVVLMTCNTTERLDAAVLRKGRIDLTHEFIQKYV